MSDTDSQSTAKEHTVLNPFELAEREPVDLELPQDGPALLDLPHGHLSPFEIEEVRSAHAPLKEVGAPLNTLPFKELRQSKQLKPLKGSVGRLPEVSDEQAVARVFGVEIGDHGGFRCPMPGHEGVATFEEGLHGELRMACDCHGKELKYDRAGRAVHHYSLADAYFSIRSGKVLDRSNYKVPKGVRLVWGLLLLGATRTVIPEDLNLPALPVDADPHLHEARELIKLLVGVRIAVKDSLTVEAVPFLISPALVRSYTGSPNPEAIIDGLIRAHIIRPVDRYVAQRGSKSLYELVQA